MTLDIPKPVQTRSGKPARVICSDRRDGAGRSIVALVSDADGETVRIYRADGRVPNANFADENDLINTPIRRAGWINIYRYSGCADTRYTDAQAGNIHLDKASADAVGLADRVACVRIEWEEAP